MAFFKFNLHGSTTGDRTLYNCSCCSNASKNQRTVHGVVNFLVCFFFFFLFQNEEGLLKNDFFALLEDSNASVENIWYWNWHLKTTEIKSSKYCFWSVRWNLEAKISFWGSGFNLLWKRVVLFKLHQCGLMRVKCTLYNDCCCSKTSKTQRTDNAVVKFLICFFFSILFQNEEKAVKKSLFSL